jgi:hypothetical protein
VVIQRTAVCVSADIPARINDCSNMLADDHSHQNELAFKTRRAIMKKPLTILSVLVIAALTMGMAVAQHMEQRAQQDRFSVGETH